MKEKIKHWIKNLTWEDYAFMGLLLILIIINILLIAPLKQLPSPLYGGDFYNHLGGMEHIAQGGSLFSSGQMLGEMPWVPWLYHLLVVIFSKITGLSVLEAIIYFSLIALIVSMITIYILISKMFSNKIIGLLAVIIMAIQFPLYKYSPFTYSVIMPIFFLAAYRFSTKKDWSSAIFLGIMYGISGLSNTGTFIATSFFMMFYLLYYVGWPLIEKHTGHEQHEHNWWKARKQSIIENLPKAAAIFAIGFLIALLWWYKPIFVYHAHTINDMEIYGFAQTTTFGEITSRIFASISRWFLDFSSIYSIVLTIGSLLGLIALFMMKEKKEEHRLMIIIFLTCIFTLFTMYITVPLTGTNLAPEISVQAMMTAGFLMFFALFLKVLIRYLAKSDVMKIIIFSVLGIFFIGMYINNVHATNESQWNKVGQTELPAYILDTREWVLANTKVNDVFLTDNEDGFALNAVTGRKMVTYRRTHASPYTDMNQRMLDAGLMLYGNNDTLREELIKKYNVKYLYWEPQWINMEFSFDDKGQIQSLFDPLSIEYTPEREQLLRDNNVSYFRTVWYLDPAWQENFPKRDLLIITPSRYDYNNPWNEKLDKYLHVAKEIKYQNQVATRIYEMNISSGEAGK